MEDINQSSQVTNLLTQHESTKLSSVNITDVNSVTSDQITCSTNQINSSIDQTNQSINRTTLDESKGDFKCADVEMRSVDGVQANNLPTDQSNDKIEITCTQLADCLSNNSSVYHLIDTRSFIEYNICHIQEATNLCCSKIIKRRLQTNKTTVRELLNNVNNRTNLDDASLIVVYDQSGLNVSSLADDSCLKVLWTKLLATFNNVRFLKGGFSEFNRNFNALCTNKAQFIQNHQKKPIMDAISQPCLPNIGPTRILPFLYLGSQVDAMNQELLKNYNITYELNVSTTCPKPDFIKDSNFLRIPVNDNYSDKLLPYFPQAINFLDKVKESSECVLVHCLGGISRSATVAIAYIMQHMKMSSEDSYRYVKGKRATISPNFNFLGQLLEFEKKLIESSILPAKTESSLLKLSENGETDSHLQAMAPLICDLNSKTFTSSSPKHHVLHHHFNPHLMSNQEKTNNSAVEEHVANQPADGEHLTSSTNLMNSSNSSVASGSTSQFANLNSNLNANGAQKRTCSFSSSPNTRNKMTLKLSSVNEKDNIGSIVFM